MSPLSSASCLLMDGHRCAGTGGSVHALPWAAGGSPAWGWAAQPILPGLLSSRGAGAGGGSLEGGWGTCELDSPGQAGPGAVGLNRGTPVTTGGAWSHPRDEKCQKRVFGKETHQKGVSPPSVGVRAEQQSSGGICWA